MYIGVPYTSISQATLTMYLNHVNERRMISPEVKKFKMTSSFGTLIIGIIEVHYNWTVVRQPRVQHFSHSTWEHIELDPRNEITVRSDPLLHIDLGETFFFSFG